MNTYVQLFLGALSIIIIAVIILKPATLTLQQKLRKQNESNDYSE